ncbi:hypothetical protein Dtox_3589 [Desulfofarcimen acetoxidans DSM 771]|jgi:uncharacterized membrane protein|uniref:Uncharacterized protein n=1 Tax=Desulfofarcimen acetoxidans (strain ATCC 49208 / DSM 771 / KCTC 5769 / VKM B-1644 / 5575) TaxID=485916 RepID=C8VW14_DESAS|nr:hypothetical protein Dtox_3589 [Desulfofarcimen acetoxidans DSM 771]
MAYGAGAGTTPATTSIFGSWTFILFLILILLMLAIPNF